MATKRELEEVIAEVQQYVQAQILQSQIAWMEYNEQNDTKLRDNEAAVLDKLHEFAYLFFDVPVPAPGQGYEPPTEVWEGLVKQRQIETIDAAVAELLRQREAIAGPSPSPIPGPETPP